jgi:hypothetical protein
MKAKVVFILNKKFTTQDSLNKATGSVPYGDSQDNSTALGVKAKNAFLLAWWSMKAME